MNKLKTFGKKPTPKQAPEQHNNEKYTEEICTPRVRTIDLCNGFVQVVMFIPGLVPTKDEMELKGGRITFTFYHFLQKFDMRTELEDKMKKVKTIYKFRLRKFPFKVSEAKYAVEKGKIIVTMKKHPDQGNINWSPTVLSQGLDQFNSSSDDD